MAYHSPPRPVGFRYGHRQVLGSYYDRHRALKHTVLCMLCGSVRDHHGSSLDKQLSDRCRSCDKVRFHAVNGSIYSAFPGADKKRLFSLATRYYAIQRRCHGNASDRKWYGDRGIECRFADVHDFLAYVVTLDGAFGEKLEVDRIDNDGHYERGNLRFVTHQQNTQNKRHRWPELRRKQKEADDNELYW